MSKTILFVLWAGGGNVPPQLTLARRVREAGHEVRVLAPAVLRDRIEAAGLVHEPYVEAPEHDEAVPARSLIRDFEARTPMGAATRVRERLLVGMARPIARDVLRIIERRQVDAVASDVMLLGGLFAAEAAGRPAAMLIHTVYPFPRPGVPPFGMGWTPAGGLPGRARDAMGAFMFRRSYESPALRRLNGVRAELGLRPVQSLEGLVETIDTGLVLTSEAFDFPGPLPSNVRYVGPQIDDADAARPWEAPWPASDTRPLVVVGLSTTFQAHGGLLQRAVDALGDLPVKGFVSTGGMELERVPPNVHTAPFAPHASLMPLADVVVTHAGLGTVHAALAHGKPMVCLPIGRDQPDNAARLVARGAGLRLGAKSGARAIAESIATILRDAAFARAARRLSVSMGYDAARSLGPHELIRLVTSVEPSERERAA